MSLVKELGDRAAQGRAYGNLGNTQYLLGNFSEAIAFHKEVGNCCAFFQGSGAAPGKQRDTFALSCFFSLLFHMGVWPCCTNAC